jgi:uncharacterized protein YjdB
VAQTGVEKRSGDAQSQFLTASYGPASALRARVTFKSSNPKVAAVDKAGRVTAKSPGKATITIKAGGKAKRIRLTVKQ